MPEPSVPSLDRPIGVALLGCGRISDLHLQAIAASPGFGRLVAVADLDLARAQEAAAGYGAAFAVQSLEELLRIAEVEAIIVCTPNAVHAAQARVALECGRHVLVEKPFSQTVAEAQANAGLADATGLVLSAAHVARHSEAVRTLQDHMGRHGKLRAVSVEWCVFWDGPQAPWWADLTRQEGLILSLFAPHAIDFVQMVAGEVDPVRLHVEVARHQSGWKAEDEAMIMLRYPDDVLASIHVSYNQKHTVNRRTAHFEEATLLVDNGNELWIDEQRIVTPERLVSAGDELLGDHLATYFRIQFREFARAVRGLPNRSLSHQDALRQTRLNHAILEQAQW